MALKPQIDHFDAGAVFRGLLDGDDYRNRVAGAMRLSLSALRSWHPFSLAQLLPGQWRERLPARAAAQI